MNKVLLIDDDEINSKALAERLNRRGIDVQYTSDSVHALDLINQNRFNLIICDIVMPELDGLTLLRNIRAKYPIEELPLIMVTAINDSSDILKAFEWGANDYVTKPVNIDALVSRINGLISISELNHERIKQKEIAALSAMIITYHHEINNPLAAVKSELQLLRDDNPSLSSSLTKVFVNLDRVQEILKKISDIGETQEVSYDLYAKKSKLVKLKA